MDEAENIAVEEQGPQDRASPRTNLMLAATAEAGGVVASVRIRNLSETGALIEGTGLPDKDGRLILHRAELQVFATVAWSAGSRRGVRFDGPVAVSDWTGGKPRPLDVTGLRDQRRVNAIQAALRSGDGLDRAEPVEGGKADADALAKHLNDRLADELGYVRRLLENMGDQLIADPVIVQRHARALQTIDLASQILAHVGAIIVAEDRAGTVDKIGMEDLRARLKRKPLAPAGAVAQSG